MLDGECIDQPSKRTKRRDVYLYFDDTDKLRTPHDAQALMRRLGVPHPPELNRPPASASP